MLKNGIIKQCKQNNRMAQMQLYNQYCNGMYIVAYRFLKNKADAEDAVQEAFIKAFSKLHQFTEDVTFGAWLKRIVVNRCIDVLKSQKQQVLDLEDNHLKVVDTATDDNWLVDDSVTVEAVKQAIEDLPDKYRYVVMLYLLEGYDHQEIASILDISEVASRTQLSRGKKKLQLRLKPLKDGTRH
ncbi:MAG: RNA polymerase sigma factor [Algicola sp.]|nr:RNA polymerase sigma factor [Algicola sp.]